MFNIKQERIQGSLLESLYLNAGLLGRSQFLSGRSNDRQIMLMFCMVFFGPKARAGLVTKFHCPPYPFYAAPPCERKNSALEQPSQLQTKYSLLI
jgi:hypothetical protein